MIVTAYLTKNEAGNVELWKTKPYYEENIDEWLPKIPAEGSEIFDELLTKFVNAKECVEVTITRKDK